MKPGRIDPMSIDRNSAFVSKYAPKKLDDVVFADFAVEQEIQRYVAREDMRPLILYGPNGTGKTTIAKLIPQEFTSGSDVYELDPLLAAIEPKVKKHFLYNLQCRSLMGTKTYILDEFDLMPKAFVRTIKLARWIHRSSATPELM
jgi:replication-associated recombination protein RarA